MSEYWVAHKKYFCKYCNIYIADDVPSRRQHEGGLRHKGNVERFVRGLYKTGEKRKQDLEEEKRDMARVEKAAQAAYAQDVAAGLVKPGSSSTSVPPPKAEPSKPARSSDPYANYSTAASLGFTDPDAERMKAEAERRMNEGVVGAWEVVELVESGAQEAEEADGSVGHAITVEEQERKRQAESHVDDDDIRPFKLRRKTAAAGLGEIYDPGIIPIKLKAKKEEAPVEGVELGLHANSTGSWTTGPSASEKPKWSAKGWNRPGTVQETTSQPRSNESSEVLTEARADALPQSEPSSSTIEAKAEPVEVKVEVRPEILKAQEAETTPPPPAGSMFRKRRVPVGAGGSRGSR